MTPFLIKNLALQTYAYVQPSLPGSIDRLVRPFVPGFKTTDASQPDSYEETPLNLCDPLVYTRVALRTTWDNYAQNQMQRARERAKPSAPKMQTQSSFSELDNFEFEINWGVLDWIHHAEEIAKSSPHLLPEFWTGLKRSLPNMASEIKDNPKTSIAVVGSVLGLHFLNASETSEPWLFSFGVLASAYMILQKGFVEGHFGRVQKCEDTITQAANHFGLGALSLGIMFGSDLFLGHSQTWLEQLPQIQDPQLKASLLSYSSIFHCGDDIITLINMQRGLQILIGKLLLMYYARQNP